MGSLATSTSHFQLLPLSSLITFPPRDRGADTRTSVVDVRCGAARRGVKALRRFGGSARSVGIITYEALYGYRPFNDATQQDVDGTRHRTVVVLHVAGFASL